MGRFAYKSVDASNRVVKGTLEATDAAAAARQLQAEGMMPIAITPASQSITAFGGGSAAGGTRINRQDLTILLSNLEMLLGAGIDLNAALAALARSVKKPNHKRLVAGVQARVQKGEAFSEALTKEAPSLPGFIINSIRAGEMGGQLRTVLSRLADHLGRFEKFRSDLVSALIYPAILLIMAVLAITILVTVVIPQFKPLFENAGAELPAFTRLVVGISDGIRNHLLIIGACLIGAVILGRALLKKPAVAIMIDRAKLRLPFGAGELFKKIEAAQFTRLSALLLESGVTLATTLELARDAAGNLYVKKIIGDVVQKVKEGGRFTRLLSDADIMPEMYKDVLEAGEEASQLETVFRRVADMAERETEQALKTFMAVFVPVLTIALGGFIAAIISSVLLALLSANDLALQ